jgi:ParB-like nuclease family protein
LSPGDLAVAVWQFAIALFPQRWLDGGGVVDALYGNDGYSTRAAWVAGDLELIKCRMGGILPVSESWSESLLFWGAEETNDIHLLVESGRVVSLSVRFDMRHPNMTLFGHVVAAAEDLRLVLLDVGRKRIVPRDVNTLLQAAAASRAGVYAKHSAQRFDAGIAQFLGGGTLAYGGAVFWKDPKGRLCIYSYPDFSLPAHRTPPEALRKIAHSKRILAALTERSPAFAAVASQLPHRFEFCNDYGVESVMLASEEDGTFTWRGRPMYRTYNYSGSADAILPVGQVIPPKASIIAARGLPRLEERRALMASGTLLPPVVVHEQEGRRFLIDGLHRYMVAREMGYTHLPVIYEDFPADFTVTDYQ